MTSHPKRPRDPNQLAKSIIDIATGDRSRTVNFSPTTTLLTAVGQFDCGRIVHWKTDCPQRILAGWRERNTSPC